MNVNSCKRWAADFVCKISIKLYYQLSYLHNRKRLLNFAFPHNLSEFIIKKIVSGETAQYAVYADKYAVRKYVEEVGLGNILPKILGVWKDVDEIEFDSLPDKFALKLNYGSGMNIICKNRRNLNTAEIKEKISGLMSKDIFWRAEPHYDLIPKCIICEEFIEDHMGYFPLDYKFMCFNGVPNHILVCSERNVKMKLFTYDLDWNKIDLLTSDYRSTEDIRKPQNLDLMIQYATQLSKGFDFVRIDLYDTGEHVFFGEMTFTPEGGVLRYYSLSALSMMGKLVYLK